MKTQIIFFFIFHFWANIIFSQTQNYSFAANTNSYSELINPNVLASRNFDNSIFQNIPLNFQFGFNGNIFHSLNISSNGYVWFGNGVLNVENQALAAENSPDVEGIIAVLSLDLQPQVFSELSYKTEGIAPNRVFTVQWKNFKSQGNAGNGDKFNFQLKLVENSWQIKFCYGNFVKNSVSQNAQVGIKGNSQLDFLIRKTSTDWSQTTAADSIFETCLLSQNVKPLDNQVFTFTPPTKNIPQIEILQASTETAVPNGNHYPMLLIHPKLRWGTGNKILNSLIINTLNTDNSDVKPNGVKIFFTKKPFFNSDSLLAATSISNNSANFENLNFEICDTNTFFWVTFDISASATVSNILDAQILANQILISNLPYPNLDANPAGNRQISNEKSVFSVSAKQIATSFLEQNSTENPILMLDIEIRGNEGNLSLDSLQCVDLQGDTGIFSPDGIKLFRTTDTFFSTANLLAATNFENQIATFNIANPLNLPQGHTFLWICADIKSDTKLHKKIDFAILPQKIKINNKYFPDFALNPEGESYTEVVVNQYFPYIEKLDSASFSKFIHSKTFLRDTVFWKINSSQWVNNQRDTNSFASISYQSTNLSDWFISPPVNLGNLGNYLLEFDISLCGNPPNLQNNNRFVVLISSENGEIFKLSDTLKTFKSTSYIDSIFQHEIIDLQNRTGIVRFAFYAESQYQKSLNFLNIKNLQVRKKSPMRLISCKATQKNTNFVLPNTSNVEILKIEIETQNAFSPLNVNFFSIDMLENQGTTNISDVSKVKIFYTENFDTLNFQHPKTKLFGTELPFSYLGINGNQTLLDGKNYFWVVFDVSQNVIEGHFLDAACPSILISDTMRNVQNFSPQGKRKIADAPKISFIPQKKALGMSVRVLDNVQISDISQVNFSQNFKPRLYFKKSTSPNIFVNNSDTTDGWKFVEATMKNNISVSFSIDYQLLNTEIDTFDEIDYFIIAQDTFSTPNVAVNQGIFNVFPQNVNLTSEHFPVINTHRYSVIINSLSGIINVGNGQNFTSLTNAGGIFEAIENSVISGNLEIKITSNLNETGNFALRKWAENGAENYTISIKPADAAAKIISGNKPSKPLILLENSGKVIIDGSFNNAGSFLTFSNNAVTDSTTVLALQNIDFQRIMIKNCKFFTGSNAAKTFSILISNKNFESKNISHDTIFISNNQISKASCGIRIEKMKNLVISENIFGAETSANYLTESGIFANFCENIKISQNLLKNIINNSENIVIGIDLGEKNKRIFLEKNTLTNFQSTTSGAKGIFIHTQSLDNQIVVSNNSISKIFGLGGAEFSDANIGIGIEHSDNISLIFNAISLSGIADNSLATTSAALWLNNGNSRLNIRNNVFFNELTNTSTNSESFAVLNENEKIAFANIDFNDYFVNGNQGILGYFATYQRNLNEWKTATSQDDNSISANPFFTSASNLLPLQTSLVATEGQFLTNFSTDISGNLRDSVLPSIGCYEILPVFATIQNFNKEFAKKQDTIFISGTFFTNAISVKFCGKTALSFSVDSATQIRAVVPSGDTTGNIEIRTKAGNCVSVSTFTIDNRKPRTTISSNANLFLNQNFEATIHFNEPILSFDTSDIFLENAKILNFQKLNDTNFSITISPLNEDTVFVQVLDSVCVDRAGNENLKSNSLLKIFDQTAPFVQFSATNEIDTVFKSFEIHFIFNEEVKNFTTSGISVTNATLKNFRKYTNFLYIAEIVPLNEGLVQIFLRKNAVFDEAGNGNEISDTFAIPYVIDTISPEIQVLSAVQSGGTVYSPFEVTFKFSEKVKQFAANDILVTNATLKNFSGSNSVYKAKIFPQNEGIVTLNIFANVAFDFAGNPSAEAKTFFVEYKIDVSAPKIQIISSAGNQVVLPFSVKILFNEDVNGFTLSDISVKNGREIDFLMLNKREYSATIIPFKEGAVQVSIPDSAAQDNAGNFNEVSNILVRYFYIDAISPTILITANTSGTTVQTNFVATFSFSEAVVGFNENDIVLTNASKDYFMKKTPTSYQITVFPLNAGFVYIDIPEGAVEDSAGNANSAIRFTIFYKPFNINTLTDLEFSISPNPVGENFKIEVFENKFFDVEIFNNEGKKLFSAKNCRENIFIDGKNFSKGIYLVKICVGERFVLKKIVKN